jgi:hypothetical protein
MGFVFILFFNQFINFDYYHQSNIYIYKKDILIYNLFNFYNIIILQFYYFDLFLNSFELLIHFFLFEFLHF